MSDKQENKINYKTKSYTIKDFYNSYSKDMKQYEYKDIDYNLFKNIVIDYFKHIQNEVIEKGKQFVLPARFGTISVRKFKAKPGLLQVDYKSSKELGKLILLLNDHSDGYRYKFYWDKKKLMIKNCTKYQMVYTRTNKRRLAQILKNKEKDYIEL